MNYGNEGKNRGKMRSLLSQMYEKTISNFIKEQKECWLIADIYFYG